MVKNEVDADLEEAQIEAERHHQQYHQHIEVASEKLQQANEELKLAKGVNSDDVAAKERHHGNYHRNIADANDKLQEAKSELAQSKIRNRRGSAGSDRSVSRIPTVIEHHNEADAHRVRTMMSRLRTTTTIHTHTIGAHPEKAPTKECDLPPFGGGKPYPPLLPDISDYVVDYDTFEDPTHPQNWTMKKKLWMSGMLALASAFSAWGSSIYSPAILQISERFGVDREVGTLGVSFYILGFATGPLVWAPLSELYGRKYPIIIAEFAFTIFNVGVAVAKDIQTILICRLFAGLFAACPLAVVAGAYADIWNNEDRGKAITTFGLTVSAPALAAPIVGSYIVYAKHLDWRYTEAITAIISGLIFVLLVFCLEESYAPVVLVQKAKELRRKTKNWGIHAKQEEIEVNLKELISKNLSRPLKLLFTEPIVFFISLYVAFIYGMLYLLLTAYPIVFARGYKIRGGNSSLPYLGLIVGQVVGGIIIIAFEPRYNRLMKKNKGIPIPENRLPAAMIGAIIFPIGLFWFAWTGNYPQSIPWIVPSLAGIFTGAGIILIFLTSLNYIVDAYLMFAASAVAANTFLRSLFGAIFPLFATYMFDALHVNWAGSLLAFVSIALMPMPFIFYFYGKRIRKRSKLAPTFGEDGQMIRANQ